MTDFGWQCTCTPSHPSTTAVGHKQWRLNNASFVYMCAVRYALGLIDFWHIHGLSLPTPKETKPCSCKLMHKVCRGSSLDYIHVGFSGKGAVEFNKASIVF